MAETIPNLNQIIEHAKKSFKNEFHTDPKIVVFAPGRVNLIGEHIDYCDGFVLPMALPMVTVIVGNRMDGDISTICTDCPSADGPKKVTFDKSFVEPGLPKWANYFKGVVAYYQGNINTSFQAFITTSVPIGGGLSSSASLEVATHTFLDALTGSKVFDTDKALTCQKAEHKFCNVPCGIMDQFISVMGKKDHALLIDCQSLQSSLIPLNDPNLIVVIVNSNVKHELSGGEYASRKEQCETAKKLLGLKSWRDATLDDIQKIEKLEADPLVVKRTKHVITEIKRTYDAAECLKSGKFDAFGKLMVESHQSLSKDFEVSTPEQDLLVKLAMEVEGVYGSRITGGGFGGCTVTLVRKESVQKLIEHIQKGYNNKGTIYICTASDGAKIVEK